MEKYLSTDFWEAFAVNFKEWIVTELPSIVILVILLAITLAMVSYLVRKLKKILTKRMVNKTNEPNLEVEKRLNTLMGIVRTIIGIVVWTIFIMIFLKKINIDIAPILAGAGIIGLAVGFGAQELVRDFITGFFILLENQIRAGDVAIINGTGGLVEKIELRTTTLRDLSGTVHIFQNGKINTISNMTKEWSAMVFDIGVAYKEDISKVMKLMKEVADKMMEEEDYKKNILEPMEVFGLDSFGDSALVIKGRIKTKPIQQWSIGREYRKRLKEVFDQHKIEIPFPHQTIYWGEEIEPLKLTMEEADKKAKGEKA
ncbi:MAG TPA: mechanosensitive ion channel family protein [Prolixibacteraceae bacterium]|nr:mechanosensitive ion channel family protein [Prolixibacteraceae bacterium]